MVARALLSLALLLLPAAAGAAPESPTPAVPDHALSRTVDDPVLIALHAEIDRAMQLLGEEDPAPYYIAAELTQTASHSIRGEDGGLHNHQPSTRRWLDVDLRIGGPDFDSSHPLRANSDGQGGGRRLPLSDDPALIRHTLWLEIERQYQDARERWATVESERLLLVAEEAAPDLVDIAIIEDIRPIPEIQADPGWPDLVRAASRALASSEVAIESAAALRADAITHWFASSQGSSLRHGETLVRLSVSARTVAEDGDRLSLFHSWDGHGPGAVPDLAVVIEEVERLEAQLAALVVAPHQEPYSGPAVLSDRAAGVFFHEVFGHRVEGHRLKQVDDAQTFRNRVGEQILPPFLSVFDDPTMAEAAGSELRGRYDYDSQGAPAERAVLVEEGVLRGFLQSRSPVRDGEGSNGHGRRSPGRFAVSRQGNLTVTSSETRSEADLRAELLRRARAEGLDHALWIDDIQGGFTFTGRSIPNAFKVEVVLARRIFVDGRPDELVRGLDLIGTPLEAFGSIVATGPTVEVFNGSCGAESGWVPVSAVAPMLLLSQVETQRKPRQQDTPPLLAPPRVEGAPVIDDVDGAAAIEVSP